MHEFVNGSGRVRSGNRAIVTYSRGAWLGGIRVSAGIGASLSPEAVARFDLAHRELLERSFPDDPLKIPHRIFVVFGRVPG